MTSGKQALIPAGHSKPVGMYSPGIAVELAGARLVFVSGQVATDARGTVLAPGDAGAQAEIVFERVAQVLAQSGGQLSDLVSVVIYATDVARDFEAISGARNRLLGDPPPASVLVEVSGLVETGCLVEISGVAVVCG